MSHGYARLIAFPVVVQREMDTLFATIMDHGHQIVGAEKCSMFFVDEEKQELWTKVATDEHGAIKVTSDLSVACSRDDVHTRSIELHIFAWSLLTALWSHAIGCAGQ